ncbi:MAG: FHA domain-containing protein, partial [Candidatus Eiseniibacteriota bacterium]
GAPAAPPPTPEAPPALRLLVLRGRTGEKEHALALARINLGRLEKVASASGKATRKNHVWFAASEDTVSRAHAHVERVGGDYLLFDDGSASGTRVLREGEEIELMPRASRGVRLRDGDRIELGKGCVIDVRMAKAE